MNDKDKKKARLLFNKGLSIGEIGNVLDVNTNQLYWLTDEITSKVSSMSKEDWNRLLIGKMLDRFNATNTIFIWKFNDAPKEYLEMQ